MAFDGFGGFDVLEVTLGVGSMLVGGVLDAPCESSLGGDEARRALTSMQERVDDVLSVSTDVDRAIWKRAKMFVVEERSKEARSG